jgi:VanZ family protein
LIQWAIVGVYVLAMFLFAGQDASSAGYTSSLLARWLPHLSAAELRQLVFLARKAVHVVAYAVLTLIVYLAARRTKGLRRVALPFAGGFAFIVAMADEKYQSRLLHRTGTVNDVLIDALGIGVTVLGLWVMIRIKRQNKEVVEDVEDKR